MEIYSQYRLEDFFQKHSWQGGLTLPEVQVLYSCAMKRANEEREFQMALRGFDPKSASSSSNNKEAANQSQKQPQHQDMPIFGDPKEYEHMTQEEKDQLTQKMMCSHKKWAQKGKIGRKNG